MYVVIYKYNCSYSADYIYTNKRMSMKTKCLQGYYTYQSINNGYFCRVELDKAKDENIKELLYFRFLG